MFLDMYRTMFAIRSLIHRECIYIANSKNISKENSPAVETKSNNFG